MRQGAGEIRPTISLCMIVKNEEQLIGQCLRSVKGVVDEILVVDTGSTDRTVEIARRFGSVVIDYKWNGNEGMARNICMRHARGSWILVLDADEKIAEQDLPKLKRLVRNTKYLAYYVKCRDYGKVYNLFMNWYPNDRKYPKEEKLSRCPGWLQYKILRLFQNREGVHYEEGNWPHVTPLESLRKLKGRIGESDLVVHHFQYLKGGDKFILGKQHGRYLRGEMRRLKTRPNPKSYLDIGKTLFVQNRDREAVWNLRKAVQLDPKYPQAYFVLGMVYKEMGKAKQAVRNLRRALRLHPRYADAWAVLGMVHDISGRRKEAEKALKKALAIHPPHLLARNALGVLYYNYESPLQAEKEFKRSLQIHLEHPDASFNLALLYESQEKYQEAAKLYRHLLKINPDDSEAKHRLNTIIHG